MRTLTIIALVLAFWLVLIDFSVFRPKRRATGVRSSGLEKLVYFFFVLSLLVMAVSSLGTIAFGGHMRYWMLAAHMTAAPIFAASIALLAVLWAEQSSFARPADERFHPGEKVAFWLTVLAGLATITSAMLLMMAWFSTDVQVVIHQVHAYSAMTLVIFAIFHAYRLTLGQGSAKTAQ